MITIDTKKFKDLYYNELLYKQYTAREKCNLFLKKYKMNFNEFEQYVNNTKKENFVDWDDYLEWKGYNNSYNDLLKELEDIKNGNFEIT